MLFLFSYWNNGRFKSGLKKKKEIGDIGNLVTKRPSLPQSRVTSPLAFCTVWLPSVFFC